MKQRIIQQMVQAMSQSMRGNDPAQRYITRLVAAMQMYYEIPVVSVDRVVMDVYSATGSNVGLPTGAPVPTANRYQTIDFTHSGSIEYIGRNGSSYFDGEIANVQLYNGGTLVREYNLRESWLNSNVVRNSASTDGSGNGIAINIDDGDATLYTDLGTEFIGPELVTDTVWQTPFTAQDEWTFANNQWALVGTGALNVLQLLQFIPPSYRIVGDIESLSGQLSVTVFLTKVVSQPGSYSFDVDNEFQQFKRVSGSVSAVLNRPSIRALLRKAT